MPDLSELTTHIARLAGSDFSRSSEQDTRERAVNPVIGALGWNTYDPEEVIREYSVRGGRVDYCLRTGERDFILVEVKRAGMDLGEPQIQEQLLRYAFDEGAPLAALTDGLVWRLYLPMAGGNWEQRRFLDVDFCEQSSDEAAAALHRFLDRAALASGEAQAAAEREFRSQERNRRIRVALQDAWRRVLGDPGSLLREELADEVERISGNRPDSDTVADFLQDILGNAAGEDQKATSQPPAKVPGPPSGIEPEPNPRETPQRGSAKKKPSIPLTAFWLDGVRHEVSRWRFLVARVCELVAKDMGAEFPERVTVVRGRERPYFTRSANELRASVPISGTGLYVEGHLSAADAERIARRVLLTIRGSDEGFRIERAEPPPGS